MNKELIKHFFNKRAAKWDEINLQDEEIIETILDNARITEGVHVLDVACGTGVLMPWYQKRKAASVTGIDLSSEMVKIASEKYPEMDIICGDAETYTFSHCFDRIMIYNAFPHFLDSEALIENLIRFLKPGGMISVAHGMSREELIKYHDQHAEQVSKELVEIEKLEQIFEPYTRVTVAVSDSRMYQLVGVKEDRRGETK